MKIFLHLPYDSSGYGKFGFKYRDVDLFLQFEYLEEFGQRKVGELKFEFCTKILMNGTLKNTEDIEYDTIFIKEEKVGYQNSQGLYSLMLSGSDFQFEILASSCLFEPNVKTDIFL